MGLETGHGSYNVKLPSWVDGSRFRWEPKLVYKTFHLLNHVHSIDIGGTSTRYHHLLDMGALFPRAQNIRLRGNMNYVLAWDILHDERKASITSLSLHDVHLEDYSASDDDKPSQLTNMRRLFQIPSLRQRCQNTQFLFLGKLGQQHATQNGTDVLLHDEEVYQEWAKFISAVEPRNLVLAHSRLPDAPWNGRPPLPTCLVFLGAPQGPPPWPLMSPMDESFCDIVLPILIKSWSRLSSLEIRGVQMALLQGLANSLPDYSLLIDEGLSPCWHFRGRS